MPDTTAERRILGFPRLWFVMLGAPIVWSLDFLAIYLFAQWACSAGFAETEILGVGLVNAVDFVITLGAMAIVLYIGWVGYGVWKTEESGEESPDDETRERRRFMALFGVIAAALFLAGLLFQAIGVLLLPPCLL